MSARSIRRFAIAAGIVALGAWLAPALLLSPLVAHLAKAAGVSLELTGVRPTLPWGVSIAHARVERGDFALELAPLRATFLPSGARIEAGIGEGSLLLRTADLSSRSGIVRAQEVPLERLRGLAPDEFALRGLADGVYRFGSDEALELTLRAGALVLRSLAGLEVRFSQVVVSAERERDGAWRVAFADLRGPPISGTGSGRIGADGRVALAVEISELDEPALSAFRLAGMPTEPLPYGAEISGTLDALSFSPLARTGE